MGGFPRFLNRARNEHSCCSLVEHDSHAGRCANDIYDDVDVIWAAFSADYGEGSEIDVQVQIISLASSSSPYL